MPYEWTLSRDPHPRLYPDISEADLASMLERAVLLERRILVPIVEGQPEYVKRVPCRINPGPIPPTYVHTWAIDVTATRPADQKDSPPHRASIFRLLFADDSPQLNWRDFDRVDILDSSGNLATIVSSGKPATFRSLSELTEQYVCSPRTNFDEVKGHESLTRFYVQLETGYADFDRYFELEGLSLRGALVDEPAAFVVDDDLNYEFRVKHEELGQEYPARFFTLDSGKVIDFPWKYERETTEDTDEAPKNPLALERSPKPKPIPPAHRSDGWYLIGRNVDEYDLKGYAALLYYNEQTSRLRVYLYNLLGPQMEASYYKVRVCLLARSPDPREAFDEVKGAFFPLDPSPRNWSEFIGCIPHWPNGTWAFVETPFMYPMSARLAQYSLPYDERKEQDRLWPIYGEACKENMRNFGIRVAVQAITVAELEADLDAQAVGDAIQQAGDPAELWDSIIRVSSAFGSMVEGAHSAASTQKAWAQAPWAAISPTMDGSLQRLTGFVPAGVVSTALAALGPAAWGTAGAIAGLAYGIYTAFFSDPDPLKLLIRLSLEGTIVGKVVTKRQADAVDFYLPGKFSLQEALDAPENMSPDLTKVPRYIPRYDRAMGHLGLFKHPRALEFPMLRLDDWPHTATLRTTTTPLGETGWGSTYWEPRSRVEPCGWRSLWIFPSVSDPKFPYCGTFFEHATCTFSGRYVEYVKADGHHAVIRSAQEALAILQSKNTAIGDRAGHNGPFWVQAAGRYVSGLLERITQRGKFPVPFSHLKEGSLDFSADLGLRIYDAQIDLNLGVRNSQMHPVGFAGIVEGARLDDTGKLVIRVRSPNLEAPEYYGGPKWILSNVTVDSILFAANDKTTCQENVDFAGHTHQWEPAAQVGSTDWRHIDELLPVIYNPYAEIVPAAPRVVSKTPKALSETQAQEWNFVRAASSEEYPAGGQNMSGFEWEHDISWQSHVKSAPDDSFFSTNTETGPGPELYVRVVDGAARHPLRNGGWKTRIAKDETTKDMSWARSGRHDPSLARPPYAPTIGEGYTLSIVPRSDLTPQPAATFCAVLDGECYTQGLQEYMMADADESYENETPPTGMWPYGNPQWFFANPVSPIYSDGEMKNGLFAPRHFRPFDANEAFPVTNVYYFWNVLYFYYGRSRKSVDETGAIHYPSRRVYSLVRAPVTMKVTRHVLRGETVRSLVDETHSDVLLPSSNLRDA